MKELNFIKSGDYYVPDIRLSKPNIRLGKWGRMRKEYLRLQHPVLFSEMVLTEKLYQHCAEIEATAKSRMDIILPRLMEYYGDGQKQVAIMRQQVLSGIFICLLRQVICRRKTYHS